MFTNCPTDETVIRIEPELTDIGNRNETTTTATTLQNNDTTSETHIHNPLVRSWRMNLNDVLSFSSAPIRTEALRSLISQSNSFRYTPLNSSDSIVSTDNVNVPILHQERDTGSSNAPTIWRLSSRSNSLHEENSNGATSAQQANVTRINVPFDVSTTEPERQDQDPMVARLPGDNANRNTAPADLDEDNNVISNGLVRLLSILARYLPFICILFAKFIHDHLWGILDLLLLHGIMYQVNKSLREQISKFSQKSYTVLMRDFSLVTCIVAYRILLASTSPDPFGLLIKPPNEAVTFELPANFKTNMDIIETASATPNEKSAAAMVLSHLTFARPQATPNPIENAVTLTKAFSVGILLYYVAVNDLVLKLLTILLKITITMLPTKIIRHKPRARMFVLVEYFSQFYRALAPVRQWLMFLFESYSGLEVISGVLFSSFYMGAKGFEFVERGKSLRKALTNFIRNMDYERKPTKEELETAGPLCPICHDAYSTPVVLECGHIFCDDCVSTWFKREQTCPMCRAKVSEDPTWQDGSTSFFYQLC